MVGVDDLGAGFNPHLLAHLSPVTTALATLVLPSVFRPDANGTLQLDQTIATSAEVVATEPFTVSYELNLEAAWSTNTPIAAEDFVYLWERMRGEPGVVDAAGYKLITEVRSRAGGKAVDVVFSRAYPAWQHLFSDLLPAHLLKDAPGSWTGATTQRPAGLRRPVPDRVRRPGPRRRRAGPQRPLLGHPDGARPAGAAPARPDRRWPPGWPTVTSTWRCRRPAPRSAPRSAG